MQRRVTGTLNGEPFEFTTSGQNMGEVASNAHAALYGRFGVQTWHRSDTPELQDSGTVLGEIFFETVRATE